MILSFKTYLYNKKSFHQFQWIMDRTKYGDRNQRSELAKQSTYSIQHASMGLTLFYGLLHYFFMTTHTAAS